MTFSTTNWRRAMTISVATFALSVSSLGAIAQALTLNGAGASFPKPLYDRYFSEFKKQKNHQVNYEAIGSGGGIKQFIADTVDFAGSDAPPKPAEIAKMKHGMLLVPTAGGAVAVAYNLPGVSDLKLSRETLPAIFMGKITRWNDAKIAAQNPGVNLPDRPIRVAVRSDGSGTTFIFTSHLSAISSEFADKVGANKAPTWPGTTVGGAKNAGVAAVVQQNEGAIGYVEADYATQNKLSTAMIENKAGSFVAPTLADANKALEGVEFNNDFTTKNSQDPSDGYPIVGVTWLLVKKQYGDAEKAAVMKELVEWILTDGQDINGELQYTEIPNTVAQRAISSIKEGVSVAGR